MFFKDGKSLFGNTGLVISFALLVIILYISYNKCYVNTIENFGSCPNPTNLNVGDSGCTTTASTVASTVANTYRSPTNVRVDIVGPTITVKFDYDNKLSYILPTKFIIILAQYDNNKKNTGNNVFFISNEYELNASSVKLTDEIYKTNVCNIVNGVPECQYVFTNVDNLDSNNNVYYYKVGVAAVYPTSTNSSKTEYTTPFIDPYNINTTDKLFNISSSTKQQSQDYNDFLAYKKLQNTNGNASANLYNATISTPDGQYELIKSQLGDYPDNLVIESQTTNENDLSNLLDKSMAQGILNVNLRMGSQTSSFPTGTDV
jgi:hypothetical protein